MNAVRKIELLSPAKNLECGMAAINHGADAVYIGAPQFSARASAGNSLEDIEQLVRYAHLYYAKVYVAFNTILKEDELLVAERTIHQLHNVGVDALIIQDMALTQINSPIALHASTQMDNRSVEKVKFLEDAGFSQVVLARELSLSQIKEIAAQVTVPLEVFVHGALCVSYSGQCYVSQALSGRSANRGQCAQYCRLPYTLQDREGNILIADKHLLSLKDMNRSDHLEDLLDAGVSSLKIEGRLKDLSYVKNVTAYYRKKLDEIFLRRQEYIPSSSGKCAFSFVPDVEKSFNRRFTDYFLKKRTPDITSFDTPKYVGENIGRVTEVGRNYLKLRTTASLHNGDGVGYFDSKSVYSGFRINRVDGDRVFPAEMPPITVGTLLYRNYHHLLEKELSQKTSERKVGIEIILADSQNGFRLSAIDEDGVQAAVSIDWAKEPATKELGDQLNKQLSKLGNTIYKADAIRINFQQSWFIPVSLLASLRRELVDALLLERSMSYKAPLRGVKKEGTVFPQKTLSYLGNVSNSLSRKAYRDMGVEKADDAFEIKAVRGAALMFTKHCLKYSLGYCPKLPEKKSGEINEPLWLLSGTTRFRLEFDCRECEMRLYRDE